MPDISEYPAPILTYFTGLLGVLVGTIIQLFVFHILVVSKHRDVIFGVQVDRR